MQNLYMPQITQLMANKGVSRQGVQESRPPAKTAVHKIKADPWLLVVGVPPDNWTARITSGHELKTIMQLKN